MAVSEPTFAGCGVVAKPVAVLWLCDQDEREPKVVCVPREDPNWQHVEDVGDLPDQLVDEIAHFFIAYKRREGHEVEVESWGGHRDAEAVIAAARERCTSARANTHHDRTPFPRDEPHD